MSKLTMPNILTYKDPQTGRTEFTWCGIVCRFIGASMVLGSILSILMSGIMLISYHVEKTHGVHETYFSFDGLYKITTDQDSYKNLIFVTNCHAITPYGNCYYEYYDNHVYQFADDYGEQHCNNRTLHGFISTETHKCTKYNPNYDMYSVSIVLKCSSAVVILYCLSLYFIDKYKKNKYTIQENTIEKDENIIEENTIEESTIEEKLIEKDGNEKI